MSDHPKTELVKVEILSIYKGKDGIRKMMPTRMALATPDFRDAIYNIRDKVASVSDGKAQLVLSDLKRSYEMQYQAHMDYVSKKKKAFSPAPGGSFHEAGRAMDVSLADLRGLGGDNWLAKFWDIAGEFGVRPIIREPISSKSEAWHFDCMGEFRAIYKKEGYKEAAKGAILDVGQQVDDDVSDDETQWVQSQLLAYGYEIGKADGVIGKNTKAAIRDIKEKRGWANSDPEVMAGPASDDNAWDMVDEWLLQFLGAIKEGDVGGFDK